MASVKQFPGSRKWYACYKVPTGRVDARGKPIYERRQRSTGIEEKSRAYQLALSYERAAVMAAEKRWSENSAKQFLAEIAVITGTTISHIETTRAFLLRWFEGHKRSWSGGTLSRYKGIIDDFLEHLGPRADHPISDISPAVVAKFRDDESSAGKSASTVNKALGLLARAFDEAKTMGAFSDNPARGLNIAGAKRNMQKRRAFKFEQFRELYRKTSPDYLPPERGSWKDHRLSEDWQTFILILGYTGGRQQEAAQLTWEQIDLSKRVLWLERTKNGDEHWMPIHPALLDHLLKLNHEREKVGPVLPYISTLERRRISNAFRLSILPRIGIRQEYQENEGKGRTVSEYSLHSLRHSLSTWLEAAGVDEKNRMDLIGHESEEVNRGYTHTELQHLAQELSKIPSI